MLGISPKFLLIIAVLTMTSTFPASPTLAQLPPLIPRDILLGNPERANPHISPDGKLLSWLAPDAHDVLQVWIQTIGGHDARVVTADKRRGIQTYGWALDSKTILTSRTQTATKIFMSSRSISILTTSAI
jgi:hypothetical protein